MDLVWYLDRAAGLVGYAALYLAVLTGILYNAEGFGSITDTARRIHIEVSVFALLVLLAHGILGVVDTWFIVVGEVPTPAYGASYLLGGVAVGAGAFLLLIVGVLGFLDARRFEWPWTPRVVHAFTYGAFVFGTIHAAAVGTDLVGLLRPGLIAGVVFLVYVLLLRTLARLGIVSTADGVSS
ncbi:hypothetical protein [Halorussus salinisoli]|uniref:hypothetical protein n=1 Tax=Halorussus salinisoli TaxID=2558242 RepID=UPI0010C1DED7|nr:hypothetical protein [Halorussus salinisoli]